MPVNWQRTVLRAMGARERGLEVTEVRDVLPWYRRVDVRAPGFLRDLEVFPTIWIRLWVPELDGSGRLRQRGYTLVDPDPGSETFALEFVMHEPAGPASHWAQRVQPGDRAEFAFTPSRLEPSRDIGHYLLIGDSSAIPAINSLLRWKPPEARATVLLGDPHADAVSLIESPSNVELHHVDSSEELIGRLPGLGADLDGTYAWAAGERALVTAVRKIVRGDWKLPKDRQHTQYYWIAGRPFG